MGEGTRLTFHELDAQTRVARRLLGRGVAKRTHVGVSFGNNPDFLVSLLAVSRIGAVAVPISTFAPGRELLRLIRYGDLAVLTTQHVVGVDQVDRLTAAIPGLEATRGPVLTLPAAEPALDRVRPHDDPPPWVTAERRQRRASTTHCSTQWRKHVVGTDVALMIHTSGTTSDPKGVPHTHDTVCFRVRYLAERMQYRPGDRTYTSQVLFWIGGLTMSFLTSIAAGATSVWCERFDADEVLPLIERERITRLAIYPHQVEQLLAHPEFADRTAASLRIADPRLVPGHEGRILTPEGHRMALGMSETFGPFSWGSGGDNVIAPVQDVQPGLEIRVVDEHNHRSATVRPGRSSCAADASRPATTSGPEDVGFDADGWFHTGDRGLVDGATSTSSGG